MANAGNPALSDLNSLQALDYGTQAARYADPFMDDRKIYQNQLRRLMKNPGSMQSSPFYKFAYNQGLNALQRKGSVRSGNKLAALQKYGTGMASQLYGQQADILSRLAMSGASPASAGLSYARGAELSMDYGQLADAQRNVNAGSQSTMPNATPWWMQGTSQQYDRMLNPGSTYSGGYSTPTAQTPVSMGGSFSYNPNTDPYIQNMMASYFPGGGSADANGPAWQYPTGPAPTEWEY